MSKYKPPYQLNNTILTLVSKISEAIGRLSFQTEYSLMLRKVNRIRTIQGSLAIEGNTLSTEQITAIIEGKRVIAPAREVTEAHNALATYELLEQLNFTQESDFLTSHKTLMMGLVADAGLYRQGGVGVMSGNKVIHRAPPADRVPKLMCDLFAWLDK